MNRILYTKYSIDRAPKFAIHTDIMENEDGRYVQKKPIYEEGMDHIRHIYHSFCELSQCYRDTKISFNKSQLYSDRIQIEYLDAPTLQEKLDQYLYAGQIDELEKVFFRYIHLIQEINGCKDFYMTPEFKEVFGDVLIPEGTKCGPVTDVDMILANVMLVGDKWELIDYEWSFEFPIPVNYLIYRIIFNYGDISTARSKIRDLDLYTKCGISEEEKEIYRQMEENFQHYVLGERIPLRSLYWEMSRGYRNVHEEMLYNTQWNKVLGTQIFYNTGAGFNENQTKILPANIENVLHRSYRIPLNGEYGYRIDPMGCACKVSGLSLTNSITGKSYEYSSNCYKHEADEYYFVESDPMFVLDHMEAEEGELCIVMDVEPMSGELIRQSFEEKEQREELEEVLKVRENELELKKQQIEQMKNTKIWRFYEWLRRHKIADRES